jgi:hypothetical protein
MSIEKLQGSELLDTHLLIIKGIRGAWHMSLKPKKKCSAMSSLRALIADSVCVSACMRTRAGMCTTYHVRTDILGFRLNACTSRHACPHADFDAREFVQKGTHLHTHAHTCHLTLNPKRETLNSNHTHTHTYTCNAACTSGFALFRV